MKKYLPILLLTSTLLTSCTKDGVSILIEQKADHNLIPGVELDLDNAFFDDFSSGVDYENWYIANQAWGGGNGGCLPDNVHYTDDGILELRGTGAYYSGNDIRGLGDVKDGRFCGAALISKFLTRPGRYEVKMKVLPRIGACNAFWTYAYQRLESGDLNHEIDIEMPGGIHSTHTPSYENILNTNYHKETLSQSQDTKLSDVFDAPFALNDGEWHTMGFDWYTNPEKLVYYIDGKICAVSDIFIPNLETRLWLGVWFPVSSAFVGYPNFEQDAMQVDYVKYIPFKDQPYTPFTPEVNGVATKDQYPTTSTTLYESNMISNGDFEYVKNFAKENRGWDFAKYLDEDKPVDEVAGITSTDGYENSYSAFVKDGGVIEQTIDATYEGFEYDLSFNAKVSSGKNGYVTVEYLGNMNTEKFGKEEIKVTGENWDTFTKHLVCPANTKRVLITIDTENGATFNIDNISMTK